MRAAIGGTLGVFLATGAALAQSPTPPPSSNSSINIQGVLRDAAGSLQSMPFGLDINLYAASDAKQPFYSTHKATVEVDNGFFNVELSDPALNFHAIPDVWVEVQVSGDASPLPRQHINAVPYALSAGTCSAADTTAAIQNIAVSSAAPTNGNVLRYDGTAKQWTPAMPWAGIETLRATRTFSLAGNATVVEAGNAWTDVTSLIYGLQDPPALPGTKRVYRLSIRSANDCIPPPNGNGSVQYQLFFGWNNRPDNKTYPGISYWGNVAEGSWDVFDLDHVADPQGGSRPTYWKLQAMQTGCGHHYVMNVTMEIYDVG